MIALARSPGAGADRVLREGRLARAALFVSLATVVSLIHAARFASEVPVEDVMFGPRRSPIVGALLASLGTELTSVVLYLVQSSWLALIVVSAFSPLLVWVLGSTAIHAAARLNGIRRPFRPVLTLFGYATALSRPIADLPGALFGTTGVAATVGQLAGAVALVWLGLVAWHGIRSHYGVPGSTALTILAVATVAFYLAPLTLVLLALVAIIVAAVVLEYVPGR